MLKVPNITLWTDIINLPKETLRDICLNLGIPEKGTVDELCDKIWGKIKENKPLQEQALLNAKNQVLGGKTSVTWFTLDSDLSGFRNRILASLDYDPFQEIHVPSKEKITSDPVLISGAVGDTVDEYYLRFLLRVSNARAVYANDVSYIPQTTTITVYFHEAKKFIEVRADPKKASKVAHELARLTQLQIALDPIKVAAPFGYNAEKIADALGGELTDAKAKPELLLENFSEEQAKAVVEILSALDNFFADEDFEALKESLVRTKEKFGEEYLAIPFTALILNGLDKVGMGVTDRDLRGIPLYDFIKPYLQPQGGYVRFPVTENGVTKSHTIRIGLTSNSIQFMTPATEEVFNYVRERLLIL